MHQSARSITVTEIHVNNGNNLLNAQFTVLANVNHIETVTYTWTSGAQYEVEMKSSKGNQFTYIATAPT